MGFAHLWALETLRNSGPKQRSRRGRRLARILGKGSLPALAAVGAGTLTIPAVSGVQLWEACNEGHSLLVCSALFPDREFTVSFSAEGAPPQFPGVREVEDAPEGPRALSPEAIRAAIERLQPELETVARWSSTDPRGLSRYLEDVVAPKLHALLAVRTELASGFHGPALLLHSFPGGPMDLPNGARLLLDVRGADDLRENDYLLSWQSFVQMASSPESLEAWRASFADANTAYLRRVVTMGVGLERMRREQRTTGTDAERMEDLRRHFAEVRPLFERVGVDARVGWRVTNGGGYDFIEHEPDLEVAEAWEVEDCEARGLEPKYCQLGELLKRRYGGRLFLSAGLHPGRGHAWNTPFSTQADVSDEGFVTLLGGELDPVAFHEFDHLYAFALEGSPTFPYQGNQYNDPIITTYLPPYAERLHVSEVLAYKNDFARALDAFRRGLEAGGPNLVRAYATLQDETTQARYSALATHTVATEIIALLQDGDHTGRHKGWRYTAVPDGNAYHVKFFEDGRLRREDRLRIPGHNVRDELLRFYRMQARVLDADIAEIMRLEHERVALLNAAKEQLESQFKPAKQ